MTAHTKVGGAWKEVSAISAKVGGTWKEVNEGYSRIAGVWKQFFAPSGLGNYYGLRIIGATSDISGMDNDDLGNLYFQIDNQLVKLDGNGDIVWNRTAPHNLKSTSWGALSVGGGLVVLLGASGVVTAYNTDGVLQWGISLSVSELNALAVDSSGNVYVVGENTSTYAIVTKLDNTGAIVWTSGTRAESGNNGFYSVFIDEANSLIYAGGHMEEGTSSSLYWESFNTSGVSQVRQKYSEVSIGRDIVVGAYVYQSQSELTEGLFVSELIPGGASRLDLLSFYDDVPGIAIDPSGYVYWVQEVGTEWWLTKFDNASFGTVVWARKLTVGANITGGLDVKIKTNGTKVWFLARGSGTPYTQRLLFSVAADGSTSGTVTIDSKSYTFTTNSVSVSSAGATTNPDTYSTTTTDPSRTVLSPTDSAGSLALEGESF